MASFLWVLAGCELLELTVPSAENEVEGLEVVWIQTTPPVAAPSGLFFVEAAIANPGLEALRAFAFTCIEDDDCGELFGLPLPVAELTLRCNSGDLPCVDVRASAGFQIDESLLFVFPVESGDPIPVELPLFVAVCPTGRCPLALTAPVESPVAGLGLDGSQAPPDDVQRDSIAVSVRSLVAKPSVENRDSNPRLDFLGAQQTAGRNLELTFRVAAGGRGVGNDVAGFTTGGRFTTGGEFYERSGVVRGDVFRYQLEPPSPRAPTTVWVTLEERGSSAGAVFSATFFDDDG